MLGAFLLFNSAELGTWVAILVWAYDAGGAAAAGLIAVVQLVPATLLAPVVTHIGDRVHRDRALPIGFSFQAATYFAVAAAVTFNWPVFLVYVTATLSAIAVTTTRPVHYATLPGLSETPQQLTAANSLSSSSEGFGAFGGPLVTAGLLALGGPGVAFWAAGVASVAAAILTRSLPVKRGVVDSERHPVAKSALEALSAIKQSAGTGRIILIFGSVFLVIGALNILNVVLGLELLSLDQSGPGTLVSALGVGAILGAAGTVVLVNRRRMAPAVAGGLIAFGLSLALVSLLGHGLISALLFLVAAGAGKAFVDVAGRTLLQRISPDWVLARVFGLHESMMMGGFAVGAAIAPLLVRWFGGRGAFLIVGCSVAVVGLSQWSSLLRLDAEAVMPGPGFELLLRIPMFAVLEQPAVERLSRDLVRIDFPAEKTVITEGEAGDRFYVIESGVVSILKHGLEVNRLGPGAYFGETALLREVPRTATVAAVTDLVLYALDRRPFLEAVTWSPLSAVEADRVIDSRANNAEPKESGIGLPNLNAESDGKSTE